MASDLDYILELMQNPVDRKSIVAAAKAWKSSTLSWISEGTRKMADVVLRVDEVMSKQPVPTISAMLVGVHGRNALDWQEADFKLIKEARIAVVKMMAHTHLGVFERLRRENPDLLIITRLYDTHLQNSYFDQHSFPTPEEFGIVASNRMQNIKAACGCDAFEIHNEPNHPNKYEGWGMTDEDALSFNQWYLAVLTQLRARTPWAKLGFPGLAIPHNDLRWIELCKPAIDKSDWLGVHTYWQTPLNEPNNHITRFWGLRFIDYHNKFPDKDIHITECGNSGVMHPEYLAGQYVEYVRELSKYDYVKSTSFFIMSSPDNAWRNFTWRTEDGSFKPVVTAMRNR